VVVPQLAVLGVHRVVLALGGVHVHTPGLGPDDGPPGVGWAGCDVRDEFADLEMMKLTV
jgi:hypothetical protein